MKTGVLEHGMQSLIRAEQLERQKMVFENEGEAAGVCLRVMRGIVIVIGEPTVTV